MPPQRKRRYDASAHESTKKSKNNNGVKKWNIKEEVFSNDNLLELFENVLSNCQSLMNEKKIRAGFSIQKMEGVCKCLLEKCPKDLLQANFSDFFTTLAQTRTCVEPELNNEDEVNLFLGEFIKFVWWGTINVDKLSTDVLLKLLISICQVPELVEFSADFPVSPPKNVQALMGNSLGITYEEAQVKWKELSHKEKKSYCDKFSDELHDYMDGCSRFLRMNVALSQSHKDYVSKRMNRVEGHAEKVKNNIRKMDEKDREESAADAANFKKFRSAMIRELPSDMGETERDKVIKEKYACTDPLVLRALRRLSSSSSSNDRDRDRDR